MANNRTYRAQALVTNGVSIGGLSQLGLNAAYQDIIASTVGKENTFGAIVGRIRPGPFTYCRVSTNDLEGKLSAYVGEGTLTSDPLNTFGGRGVVQIPRFQQLLHYICENGFEHHVALNLSQTAAAVHEALSKYLGWDVYWHGSAAT